MSMNETKRIETRQRPVTACCGGTVTDPLQQYLTANSDRLSHFGHRISLFLRTLVLRAILSREQGVETCIRRYEPHESLSNVEEFQMKKILTKYGVCLFALALMLPLARAQAQPAGLQTALAKDAGTLSEKFSGLARVMSGKYDWKPGQGIRSVGDVFNLIVKENGLLAGVLSGTPNTGAKPAPINDPEKMQEALKASYMDLQKAIKGLSDNDLQSPVKLFGKDMTKQSALLLILEDQHEHLGQSIAYARSNGVVPPWSK
jgi:uncharacterized damage-inducible protein DinB